MEAVSLNKKENIIEAYSLKPTLPYDVEGILVEKEGKNVKIEKTFEDKNIQYNLRLKEEIVSQIGERVNIDKENILSMKIEEKKEENIDEFVDLDKVIKKLGFEDIEETKKAIEYLINYNIPINRDNLETFFMSKKYLEEIVENIDFNSCIELFYKDIDIGEDSLQKIAEELKKINTEEKDLSIIEILKSNKSLSYKEAEVIAKDIYGTKMGKDVYDSIIALHKQGIPINKENIENVMEVIHKLQDLKEYDDEILVKALKEDLTINIENLYKLKYSYTIGEIDTNITSPIYDSFTIKEEISLEDILHILRKLNLDEIDENINLIREFMINKLDITIDNIEKIINMKNNLEELIILLDEVNVVRLMEEGIDPLKEDISQLVKEIKNLPPSGNIEDSYNTEEILKEIEELKTVTHKDLINLIKSGKEFKIEDIKELKTIDANLNKKVVEKAITISNIFNTLEELDSNTIAFAVKRYDTISLNNLYESQMELDNNEEMTIEPINMTEENFIRQEYLNAKNNTTLNLIKMSVKDGLEIEYMAIDELNEYIDKNINKMEKLKKLSQDIVHMKGKEEVLISMAMKNYLNISINQLNCLNNLLYSSNGLGYVLNSILKSKFMMDGNLKEGIEILENKIKEFSTSLKEGNPKINEKYKDIIEEFDNLSQSLDFQEDKEGSKKQLKEYLELQNIVSKEDLVLQLPIASEEGYKNINLIIPNVKKGIDKNDMFFYFNMDIEPLGELTLYLKVLGKDIYVDFEGNKGELILKYKYKFEERLNKIGYNLKELNIVY
ncbi:hypothetical protein EDD65_10773 [Keratinibaculum paraultunense]|uniref:Flagellar hook-length control protein FliK n=1 Tax=Keratinibaculum paraultunense TaxID=1278232 RepID=A0A4R3KW90_9FIRM|nr:DUF6240 domain-containing protein [Keratinibaculum paraultunense]QQY79838.1 hypothetical protein JL105_00425 [Keratinibaculum paraultunense]TCS88720.1 hypothetical protein EDD65_10773 [Keratinibaculum paraultunense]